MNNRVKELRVQYNMTQEQLAELVGVSRQSIIAIENQRYNPSLELAFKLSRSLHKNIEEVFIFDKESD